MDSYPPQRSINSGSLLSFFHFIFFSLSLHFFSFPHSCIMDIHSPFSTEDPEIDFSLLLQDSEHVEDDLFTGLGEVHLHVEENPSGVEQWLEEGELGATAPIL